MKKLKFIVDMIQFVAKILPLLLKMFNARPRKKDYEDEPKTE